jgi:preprotein translocase subunit SecE
VRVRAISWSTEAWLMLYTLLVILVIVIIVVLILGLR